MVKKSYTVSTDFHQPQRRLPQILLLVIFAFAFTVHATQHLAAERDDGTAHHAAESAAGDCAVCLGFWFGHQRVMASPTSYILPPHLGVAIRPSVAARGKRILEMIVRSFPPRAPPLVVALT